MYNLFIIYVLSMYNLFIIHMYNLYIRQRWATTHGTLNWWGNTPAASVSLRAASEMAALYACATHCRILMVMWPKHIQAGLVYYLPHPISIIHPSIIQVSSKYHPILYEFLVYHPYLPSMQPFWDHRPWSIPTSLGQYRGHQRLQRLQVVAAGPLELAQYCWALRFHKSSCPDLDISTLIIQIYNMRNRSATIWALLYNFGTATKLLPNVWIIGYDLSSPCPPWKNTIETVRVPGPPGSPGRPSRLRWRATSLAQVAALVVPAAATAAPCGPPVAADEKSHLSQ